VKKRIKTLLTSLGITFGVLIVGLSVAYGVLGTPPDLAREVTVLEELLPEGAKSYVAFPDLDAAAKLYGRSRLKRLARKLGIEEDFENLEQVRRLNERTNGRFWDIIGSRFITASYTNNRKLVISQPRWKVKTLFRAVLERGRKGEYQGIAYSVFPDGSAVAFAGDYFWFATSEKLLKTALRIAASSSVTEEDAFPVRSEGYLIYGVSRKRGEHLAFDEFRYLVYTDEKGLAASLEVDRPSGVLGDFIRDLKPPSDYSRIPHDAYLFINLAGVNPDAAWENATKLAKRNKTETSLAIVDMEEPMATLAEDAEDEVLFCMQGWDVDLWYAPALWTLSVKASSASSYSAWEALIPQVFGEGWEDVSSTHRNVSYNAVHSTDSLAEFPPLAYFMFDGALTISSDTNLVPWILDANSAGNTMAASTEFRSRCSAAGVPNPIFYLDWNPFKEELKDYLLYAADRILGFTPSDVERKIFPLLDGLEITAVLADVDKDGESLVFTIRGVK